jgi:hypothetical protein
MNAELNKIGTGALLLAAVFTAPLALAQTTPAAPTAAQATTAAPTIAIKPPPAATLQYKASADVRGLSVDGESRIDWSWSDKQYRLLMETRTLLTGVLLADSSEGRFDNQGFAPDNYSARRLAKSRAVAKFDRVKGELDFAGNGPARPLQGGEQDRVSILWQLLSMMRARPDEFVVGSRWNFFVAGHRGGDDWTFEVKERARLRTAFGDLDTLHLAHVPEDSSSKTRVDVWFAPSQEWFPVRIRFSEPNGDYVDQTLESVKRK